jgi:hypothetical protein
MRLSDLDPVTHIGTHDDDTFGWIEVSKVPFVYAMGESVIGIP